MFVVLLLLIFFCKQKTAYEMRISDWSSDVCSSDLNRLVAQSAAMGALPTLYAATAPGMVSGMLIGPDGPFEMRGYPQPTMPSRRAQDAALAGRLWELSESLTGVSLPV